MKNNPSRYIYALDIGSKKLTLAAGALCKDGRLSPIYIETQGSKGIFKGVVNDLAQLSDSIQRLFKKMQARTQEKAQHVAISINGNYIDTRNSVVAMALSERGTRSITKRDMNKLRLDARSLGMELDENLLHEYPQGYSVDRHNMTLNPLGLHGRRLELDLLLVFVKNCYIENIAKAVEQAGFDTGNFVFSAVASAEAVLSDEDKERGAVLVDMGDTLTSILIFKDGIVRRARVVAFGGKNISEIISNFYKVPAELADEIKESYLEIAREIADAEEVMIKAEHEFKAVKKKELASIVAPEVDKFTSNLKSIIFESGVSGISGSRIVATGGLALLEGLLEKMEQDIGLPVKMGKPKGADEIPISKITAYAAAVGLLYLQKEFSMEGRAKFQLEGKNKVESLVEYVKTLYQDYF